MVHATDTAAAGCNRSASRKPGVHANRAGQAIRAWRRSREPRWSAEDFALHYEISPTAVYRYETGKLLAPMALALRLDADGVCPLVAWGEPATAEQDAAA